jgi:hypothetical protein
MAGEEEGVEVAMARHNLVIDSSRIVFLSHFCGRSVVASMRHAHRPRQKAGHPQSPKRKRFWSFIQPPPRLEPSRSAWLSKASDSSSLFSVHSTTFSRLMRDQETTFREPAGSSHHLPGTPFDSWTSLMLRPNLSWNNILSINNVARQGLIDRLLRNWHHRGPRYLFVVS